MRTIQRRKNWFVRLLVPGVLTAFLAYFSTHAEDGDYGRAATLALKAQLEATKERREELRRVRERLEQRVLLLADGTLERDMIDERAREALGYAAPDEIVIFR